MTQMYYSLKVEVRKWVSAGQNSWKSYPLWVCFLAFSSFERLPAFLGSWLASVWCLFHHLFIRLYCVHLDDPGASPHGLILNSITPMKSFLPDEVTYLQVWDYNVDFVGDYSFCLAFRENGVQKNQCCIYPRLAHDVITSNWLSWVTCF